MKVAVDLGFGYVKVVSENGKKAHFPSLITKKTTNTLGGLIGSEDDYVIEYQDRTSEKSNFYYVGDSAINNCGTRRWENKGVFNMEDMKIFIATAVSLVSNQETAENIQLVIGLPMSYFNQSKDELIKVLSELNAHIKVAGINKGMNISFSDVYCFPQGAGAYYSGVLNEDGTTKNANILSESVGLIDIGFRTVDFLVMQKGRKKVTYVDNLSGSLEEEGMNKIYQLIDKMVSNQEGIDFGALEIEKALTWFNGSLNYQKKTVNLLGYEETCCVELAEEIASKIKQKWGKSADMLERIYITGGGGEALFEYLKDKFPQAELQTHSTYANCLGYLGIYARSRKQQEKVG